MRTDPGVYSGTAEVWSGETVPVYIEWVAEPGGQVSVTSAGTVTLAGLHGTAFNLGSPSYDVGPSGTVNLWFNVNSGTSWGGSVVPVGDFDLTFSWSGTASGETFTRTMKRTVLLRIV